MARSWPILANPGRGGRHLAPSKLALSFRHAHPRLALACNTLSQRPPSFKKATQRRFRLAFGATGASQTMEFFNQNNAFHFPAFSAPNAPSESQKLPRDVKKAPRDTPEGVPGAPKSLPEASLRHPDAPQKLPKAPFLAPACSPWTYSKLRHAENMPRHASNLLRSSQISMKQLNN